jgi:hypothetical protein
MLKDNGIKVQILIQGFILVYLFIWAYVYGQVRLYTPKVDLNVPDRLLEEPPALSKETLSSLISSNKLLIKDIESYLKTSGLSEETTRVQTILKNNAKKELQRYEEYYLLGYDPGLIPNGYR